MALRGFCNSAGSVSRTTRKVPVRLTPMIWFHRSRPIWSVCTARRIPAAFTTESRPPRVSTAALLGLGGGLVQAVGGDVRRDDGGAFVQQSQRGRLPDARCRTGHQYPI